MIKKIYNARDLMKVPNKGTVIIDCKDGNGVVSIINFLYHTDNIYYVLTKNCGKKELTVEYMQKYVMSVLNGHVEVYVPSSDKAKTAVLLSIKGLVTSEEDRSFTKYTKWVGDYQTMCSPTEAEMVEECIRTAKIRNRITFNLKGIEDKDFVKTYHQCSEMGLITKNNKPVIDTPELLANMPNNEYIDSINLYNQLLIKTIKTPIDEEAFNNILLEVFDNYATNTDEENILLIKWMYGKTKEEPELLIDFLPLRNDYMKLCENLNLLGYSRQVILNVINKLYNQDRLINMPEGFSESKLIDFEMSEEDE